MNAGTIQTAAQRHREQTLFFLVSEPTGEQFGFSEPQSKTGLVYEKINLPRWPIVRFCHGRLPFIPSDGTNSSACDAECLSRNKEHRRSIESTYFPGRL